MHRVSKTLYHNPPRPEVSAYEKTSKNYRKLYQLVKHTMRPGDSSKLKKAFHIALAAYQEHQHWGKDSDSFLQPIEVARVGAENIGLGVIPIICTLLYGMVKDIAPAEIKKEFGTHVAQTIRKLIELEYIAQFKGVNDTASAEAIIIALTKDPNVALIRIAENLQKMQTLAHLPHEQRASIVSQARYIYMPIAHRLGLNAVKLELEDMYLKFTNAKVYHALTEQLKSTRTVRKQFIQKFSKPIQEALQRKNFPFTIKTRIKSVASIWNKMKAMGLSFEQVYDIFAIRIILDVPIPKEKLSCWQAYEVVTSLYRPHPGRFRNWVSYPRSNGYQSLHATVMSNDGVWIEVQIRTKRMDEMAEKGYAAHWKYKKASNMQHIHGLDTWLSQLRTALEEKSHCSNELVDTIDTSLQIDTIEVFTHKSQAISLPLGATVLDFAFKLGTMFGFRCVGARVNNKLVAYHYTLKHSDQVKVITTGKQRVLEDWLDFTVTHRARSAIKKFLQQEKEKAIAKGKKLVQEHLAQFPLEWNAKIIEQLLVLFDEEKEENFYYKLGEGIITFQHLGNFSSMPYKIQRH
jgi:guanosine-3',5'-bis(diphosphate) 3'-pyrophosphohydrolase